MKTITFFIISSLICSTVFGQDSLVRQDFNDRKAFVLLIVSAREDSRKAEAQKDVLTSDPEILTKHNLRAFQVLPTVIKPLLTPNAAGGSQFGKFRRLLDEDTAFQVYLMSGGTTIFKGKNTISRDEILKLINEEKARNNPREIQLDTIQRK
jgi:hypothetical protein